jgi:hypothetical protein
MGRDEHPGNSWVVLPGVGLIGICPIPSHLWRDLKEVETIPVPMERVQERNPQTFRWEMKTRPNPENRDYLNQVREAGIKLEKRILELGVKLQNWESEQAYQILPRWVILAILDRIKEVTSLLDPYTLAAQKLQERIERFPVLKLYLSQSKKSGSGIKPISTDQRYEESEARRHHNYTVSQWNLETIEVRADLIAEYWEHNLRNNYVEFKKAELIEKQSKKK